MQWLQCSGNRFISRESMDKDQLRNRYDVLRMQYVTIKALLDQSDFNWDENTCIITAKDDTWGNYIKEHLDAERMRSNWLSNLQATMHDHILSHVSFIYFFIYLFISLSSILN